ncbi:MAG: UDP-N-acetylglucosamine 2-epimerase (non-hydrolyzing) [Gemmatimonadota bacterium]|nr:UDP-N-acetylglucosamine 2-epimerase (non-hydrolyzing) [Gemmatimonadota bacterium]
MKVMTILGTRPEIIRLSLVIKLLDQLAEHTLVHTGQNFTDTLTDIFFREMDVRQPDVHLAVRGSFGEQVGMLLPAVEKLFTERRPDRLLVLGDTNSGIAAVIARRFGIPVYHMEAGNRAYDDRIPEEVNRRVIDHASSILMPYTANSRANLIREGFPLERILVTGNPIKEVIDHHAAAVNSSTALTRLKVEEGKYFLVTAHRAENVDNPERLNGIVGSLRALHAKYGYPVLCSVHPRTAGKMQQHGISTEEPGVHFLEPLGFFDFIRLERGAFCVLTDSGTVQEETCIMQVPNVTIREVTERPETVECGSNFLAGTDPGAILAAVEIVTQLNGKWTPPVEYLAENVAATVCRIVTSYRMPDPAEIEWRSGARS